MPEQTKQILHFHVWMTKRKVQHSSVLPRLFLLHSVLGTLIKLVMGNKNIINMIHIKIQSLNFFPELFSLLWPLWI